MRFRTAAALSAISVFLVLAPAAQAQPDWLSGFKAQAPAVNQSGHREWVWQGKDSLRYGGFGHVRYEPGGTPRIIVTGDPEEVANIEVSGGVIRRRDTPGFNFNFRRNDPKLEVLVQGVTLNNFDLAEAAAWIWAGCSATRSICGCMAAAHSTRKAKQNALPCKSTAPATPIWIR